MSAPSRTTGLTYQDLQRFPDDGLRREIIAGELLVTAAPAVRHQQVVVRLVAAFYAYQRHHGGEVLPGPLDVYFTEVDVVEPDVVWLRAEHADRLEQRFLRGAPDLVVEVSSPATRRVDLGRKRELYAREGVPEYWFVDLDVDRVEIYRLAERAYGPPLLVQRGDLLETPQAPGLSIPVDDLLGRRPEVVRSQ